MTTLAVEKPRTFVLGDENLLPMVATDTIYQGAAVSVNSSGYAQPLAVADANFAGFALETVTNAGAAGAAEIRVLRRGRVRIPVTGGTIDDVGKAVYAADDDDFTMTATSNVMIGVCTRFVSTGILEVAFDAGSPPGTIAAANLAANAVETAKIAADAVTGAKIADDAVSLEHLDPGITPSHIVFAAGIYDWAGGAATTASIAVVGLEATDVVQCTLVARASTETLVLAVNDAANDQIDLTLSANGTNTTTKIAYTVYRAVA